MRRTLISALAWLVVVLASEGVAAAQSDAPTPYAEYRAGVEAAIEAERVAQESTGTISTVKDTILRFHASLDRAQAEVDRLKAITPEPCYADANAELIAYQEYSIATLRDTLPLIEDAESVMGMLPLLFAAAETIRAAHPAAFVKDASSMSGWIAKPINILDTFATCEVVPSPPASAVVPSPGPASAPPAHGRTTVFSGSGSGTTATAPFPLEPGDHVLDVRLSSSEPNCSFGVGLRTTDQTFDLSVGGYDYWYEQAGPYEASSWLYAPTTGRYYLDVSGDCRWDLTLDAAPSPFDGGAPIEFAGRAFGASPSFALDGGDYVVRYTLTAPASQESCHVLASGIVDPASPYSDLGGDIDLEMDAGSTTTGETYVYGIQPGRYQYVVRGAACQFGLAEPVAWDVTIEPLR